MTNFETLNNMDINFAEIPENELMEMEGGVVDPLSWTIYGIAAWKVVGVGAAGLGLGYLINK